MDHRSGNRLLDLLGRVGETYVIGWPGLEMPILKAKTNASHQKVSKHSGHQKLMIQVIELSLLEP